jgi:hypothetical protein
MRIVYLVDRNIYITKMSRVRFDSIDAIKRYPGVSLKKTGPGWPEFVGCGQVDKKYKPDLVIWYKPLGMSNWNKIKTPKCLRYNEMWNINWTKHEIKISDSRLVICHHYNDIERYKDKIGNEYKLVHNPHCAEQVMFHDWGEKKTIDVLLSGTVRPKSCYPLRYKFACTIGRKLKARGVKYQVFKHPGYKIKGLEAIKHQNKKYAKAINRAKIAVTCSSDFKYALAKYSEIPMCHTVLCADIPKENKAWYRKWMIEISKDYNGDKICDVIQSYLKDDGKLKELTNQGFQENLKYRTQEEYARRFMKIAEAFLNGRLDDYDFQTDAKKWYNGGDGEHK